MTIDTNYPSFGSSHIDQPKDPGEMTRREEDELFDATLERSEVADMVAEAVVDELTPGQWRDIVTVMFRRNGTRMGDFMEVGRLMYKFTSKRVEKIVEDASSNTVME